MGATEPGPKRRRLQAGRNLAAETSDGTVTAALLEAKLREHVEAVDAEMVRSAAFTPACIIGMPLVRIVSHTFCATSTLAKPTSSSVLPPPRRVVKQCYQDKTHAQLHTMALQRGGSGVGICRKKCDRIAVTNTRRSGFSICSGAVQMLEFQLQRGRKEGLSRSVHLVPANAQHKYGAVMHGNGASIRMLQ